MSFERVREEYPKTRSQVKRLSDAEKIVAAWKKLVDVKTSNAEVKYMQKFNGKLMPVYQPSWHSNRHRPCQYQGRNMKYIGEEMFAFGEMSDDLNKMYVVAETNEWLMGFQFLQFFGGVFDREARGYRRLLMQAWHK
jgi:hypothetical protein